MLADHPRLSLDTSKPCEECNSRLLSRSVARETSVLLSAPRPPLLGMCTILETNYNVSDTETLLQNQQGSGLSSTVFQKWGASITVFYCTLSPDCPLRRMCLASLTVRSFKRPAAAGPNIDKFNCCSSQYYFQDSFVCFLFVGSAVGGLL